MCWKVVPNDDIGMKFNRGNPPIRDRLQPDGIVRLSEQDKLTVAQIFEKTNNSYRNNSKSSCHFCLLIALYSVMFVRVLETV